MSEQINKARGDGTVNVQDECLYKASVDGWRRVRKGQTSFFEEVMLSTARA